MSIINKTIKEFTQLTAAKTPTPGGGSVAGVVGVFSATLAEMTLNFSKGKKNLNEFADYHEHLKGRLAKAGKMFEQLIDDDISAFTLYQQANRMNNGAEKEQATELALAAAIDVPLEVMKISLALLEDFELFSDRCNKWLITDLLAAAALAVAVVRLSYYNVRMNLSGVKNKSIKSQIRESIDTDLDKAIKLLEKIEKKGDRLLPS